MRFARKSGVNKKSSFNKTPEEASSWVDLKQGISKNEEFEKVESKEDEIEPVKKNEVVNEKSNYYFIYSEDAKRINKMFKKTEDLDEKKKGVIEELINAKKTLFKKRKSICYNCCKYGHPVAKCPEITAAKSTNICICCKMEGHIFSQCPKPNGGNWCYKCQSNEHRIYFCPELTDDEPKSRFYTCNENGKVVKADVKLAYADLKRKKEEKAKSPARKKMKPNIKKGNGGPITVEINGENVKLVSFDKYYVKEEDFEKLSKLKEKYLTENLTRSQLLGKMKKFRKLAEKNAGAKICYACNEKGHNINICPRELAKKNRYKVESTASHKFENKAKNKKECLQCRKKGHTLADCRYNKGGNICFKCGSTEHALSKCPTSGNELKFAKCFICNQSGHISKNCPDNPRGLYPQGGGCLICGDVTHLKRDCPKILNQKKKEEFTIGTIDDNKLEALEEEPTSDKNKVKKRKLNKIVKF